MSVNVTLTRSRCEQTGEALCFTFEMMTERLFSLSEHVFAASDADKSLGIDTIAPALLSVFFVGAGF